MKRSRSKSAPSFAVDACQQVQVEPGRDPGGVVIGRFEGGCVLGQVGAEQQAIVFAHGRSHLGEQLDSLVGRVVAQTRTEEDPEPGPWNSFRENGQGIAVVGHVAGHPHRGELADQGLGRLDQGAAETSIGT